MSLIEKIWYESHWASYLLAPLLWPLSKLFGFIARRRRKYYLANSERVYKAKLPVIVVGNISIGGNGKTPVVIWLVEALQKEGLKPGVISRGFGGNVKDTALLIDDKTRAEEAGDEPVLIYQRTHAPVAVCPDRKKAIEMLMRSKVDIIISDDGLQHYKLARDLEIVVIDGKRRFGNQHYLPFGPLRELPSRLAFTDLLICNGGIAKKNEEAMSLIASELINLNTREIGLINQVENAIALAGIGDPSRFFTTLEHLNVTVSQKIPLADHQAFSDSMLSKLANTNKPIIMTEKDAVKCQEFVKKNAIHHWWFLPVNAQFSPQSATRILTKIDQIRTSYGSPSS